MAVSNISIANRALTILSTDRIIALPGTTEQGRKIYAIFDDTRDALLEEHNWNFAMKERTLSLLSDEPVLDDWTYCYQLPSDCIRVVALQSDYPFVVMGNVLYTNSDDPRIRYISRETDPTKFSKGFVKAFASRLAADLAYGITQNATLADNLDSVALRDLKEAKWSDGQEGVGIRIVRGSMVGGT